MVREEFNNPPCRDIWCYFAWNNIMAHYTRMTTPFLALSFYSLFMVWFDILLDVLYVKDCPYYYTWMRQLSIVSIVAPFFWKYVQAW